MGYKILSDIAKLNMGQSPKSEFYTDNDSYIPFLQGNRTFGYKTPSFDTYCTAPMKIASKGSVIMSVRAPVGDLNIAPTELCLGRGVCEIKANDGDNQFLYYVLKANQSRLQKSGNGSIFKSINRDELLKMQLLVPSDEGRDFFTNALKALDDKYELNLSLIKDLEQYSQLLFHKWFVDFDFPDKAGKPYKSAGGDIINIGDKQIPSGWALKSIDEIVIKKTDAINPMDTPDKEFDYYNIPYYDITKMHQKTLGGDIGSNKYKLTNNVVLVSKLNPWFKRVVYPYKTTNSIASTEFVVLEPKNMNEREYLYTILNSNDFINYCVSAATGTSNSHKRVKPNHILKYTVAYNKAIVNRYNDIIKPMVILAANITSENNKLIKARDLLIQKLI